MNFDRTHCTALLTPPRNSSFGWRMKKVPKLTSLSNPESYGAVIPALCALKEHILSSLSVSVKRRVNRHHFSHLSPARPKRVLFSLLPHVFSRLLTSSQQLPCQPGKLLPKLNVNKLRHCSPKPGSSQSSSSMPSLSDRT